MIGYLLTTEQAELLMGNEFKPACRFNPIEDSMGRILLTEKQVDECVNENFMWVKNLEQVEFEKKIININNLK